MVDDKSDWNSSDEESFFTNQGDGKFSADQIYYKPIGYVHSPYKDPDTTPIQPVFDEDSEGTIEILEQYEPGLKDLDGFSHLFVFYYLHKASPARMTVKPFLQDVERGIFATRAPCRPNPIGLSIVKLKEVRGRILDIVGVDILDGSAVLDIKPYCEQFDKVLEPRCGWQDELDSAEVERRGKRQGPPEKRPPE
ncbi:MAG: tRNA (N6-threonylcarbamoyladenosine(37)-N6)-methyltransferase TrmO [Deltaproteobacteria bacterium]|nr:tRNA (N6-threonylcarbamoyladenosine(37)-N6)-methyltransferase TrmO [Deltaproteobacteria bacterium]